MVGANWVLQFFCPGSPPSVDLWAVDIAADLCVTLLAVPVQISALPSEFSGKVKTRQWISRLHQMSAAQELSADDIRQLLFDLESSYNEFMAQLPSLS